MLDYLLKLFLIYAFVAVGTYFAEILGDRFDNKRMRKIIIASVLGGLFLSVVGINHQLNWHGMPDTRYLLVGFATFYIDILAALPLIILVGLYTLLSFPDYFIQSTLVMILVALSFYLLKRFFDKHLIQIKAIHLLIISILPVVITMPLAMILFNQEIATETAFKNSFGILMASTALSYAFFYFHNTHVVRKQTIEQLQTAKDEIQEQYLEISALYEEMAASEQLLSENYDALEKYKDTIEYYAYHDPKSGFYTRDYLLQLLKTLWDSKTIENYTLIYLRAHDLDYYLNTLGQTLSEILHALMGVTINEQVYGIDTVTIFDIAEGRYALLAHGSTEQELIQMLDGIREKLVITRLVENLVINVSLDIGAVAMNDQLIEAGLWIEFAEIAMLESGHHKSTRQLMWFSQEMYTNKKYRTRLEVDLQHAIENKELYMVYQPQVNKDRKIEGAEALIRWQHGEFGMISPAIFIPLAEKLGLIDSIGQFVIDEVLAFIGQYKNENATTIPISINVSFIELINPDYISRLKSKMQHMQITAEDFQVEITETGFADQMEKVRQNISELTAINVKIHLDDFGTGYSTLSHISEFSVSTIKIDKIFIDSILLDKKNYQVIRSLIELAHRLDMKVIAEGVELEAQFIALTEMACDDFQGYLFYKPLSAEDFKSLIKDA